MHLFAEIIYRVVNSSSYIHARGMKSYILILTLLVSLSFGSTINIPSDYPSIQEGIGVASDGDTVLVHPGTYYGSIDFDRKNLVVASLLWVQI